MKRIRAFAASTALAALLAACGYVSEYEKAVYDYEPIYCYQSLAGVACFKEPYHRDEKRLVNYYGPAPERYDRPAPPPPAELYAPPSVDYFVRDPDPAPEPAPPRKMAPLPWLGSGDSTAVPEIPPLTANRATPALKLIPKPITVPGSHYRRPDQAPTKDPVAASLEVPDDQPVAEAAPAQPVVVEETE